MMATLAFNELMLIINHGKKNSEGYEIKQIFLKPELKMKAVRNTCKRELGRIKSVKENYYKRFN